MTDRVEPLTSYTEIKPGDLIVRCGIEYRVLGQTYIIGPDIYVYGRNTTDGQVYYWTALANSSIWRR